MRKPDNTGKKLETAFKPGKDWAGNSKGRPKGSRNKFAEEFIKDFLNDWQKNGKDAIKKARRTDPVAYVKVAASLLPKEFDINMNDEAALEKLLEKFDDKQLETIFTTIAAAGSNHKKDTIKTQARVKSSQLH